MGRIEKINQAVKREVSSIIHSELKDPHLEFITITQVEVSRDLQHARVYFSVLGDKEKIAMGEQGLNRARGFVRKLIGQRIRMRFTPEIEFIYDRSVEYSMRIEEALEELKNEPGRDHQHD